MDNTATASPVAAWLLCRYSASWFGLEEGCHLWVTVSLEYVIIATRGFLFIMYYVWPKRAHSYVYVIIAFYYRL